MSSFPIQELATKRLSQNVALLALDHHFDTIEDSALYVLTDIAKEMVQELGSEIKRNSEIGMRSEPNLLDALNATVEHGFR
mmetsp:Transcript_24255/g.37401  ORF Transcript_24255/g.37401 Transcript_24255/m.37401 type:complete len:81 (+) Transcript_24255:12-254(+)